MSLRQIAPCLWFDNQAEEAANFYVSIFPESAVGKIVHYGEAGFETHGGREGSVMTVDFTIKGQAFTALNGGPLFKFSEAVSFQIFCRTQEEIDYYWEKLKQGGDEKAQQCGWLKDKYGVSWQVSPEIMADLISDPPSPASERVMTALLEMKKLDIAVLQRAHDDE